MSLYEGMFLLDSRQANRDWDSLMESLKAVLAKHGAEIVREVKWGERKLAYDINGRRRGTYVLCYFNAPGEAITPIYREVELSDVIHRALILKVAKMPSDEEMFVPTEGAGWRRGARAPGAKPEGAAAAAVAEPKVEASAEAVEASAEEKPAETAPVAEASAEVKEEVVPEVAPDVAGAEDVEAPKSDAASSDE